MKSRYVLMAEMFKALGDENRLKLLEELKDGEKNAGELLEKLSRREGVFGLKSLLIGILNLP